MSCIQEIARTAANARLVNTAESIHRAIRLKASGGKFRLDLPFYLSREMCRQLEATGYSAPYAIQEPFISWYWPMTNLVVDYPFITAKEACALARKK